MKLGEIISSQTRRLHRAFSLVEASIGMGLVSVTMVALFSGFTTGFFNIQMARENLRATQILLEKMETIRLYKWDQINTPGYIPTTFTAPYDPNGRSGEQGALYRGTITIANAPVETLYAKNMRLVTVTLQWATRGLQRTRTFHSYIARNGLQNYIY